MRDDVPVKVTCLFFYVYLMRDVVSQAEISFGLDYVFFPVTFFCYMFHGKMKFFIKLKITSIFLDENSLHFCASRRRKNTIIQLTLYLDLSRFFFGTGSIWFLIN